MRSSDEVRSLPAYPARFFLVRASVFFLFAILAARLVYVQAVLRTELQERARKYESRSASTLTRNAIVDRNDLPLAENAEVYSCFIDPSIKMDRHAVAAQLARPLGLNESLLLARLKQTRGSFLWLRRNVSVPIVLSLKEKKIPGLGFKREMRRQYPSGTLATHLLGLVGVDGHGLSGIESAFENVLGADNVQNAGLAAEELPKGQVQLTIDAGIQRAVERELDWGVKKTQAKAGMALVQDPWTGEILAVASWPPMSLNPDDPPDPKELRVPAAIDVFEPGSTFKLVTAAAALEEKVVKPGDTFDGEHGAWKVADITIHDHEPLKRMTFDDMMVYSSNIGAAKVGERLGSDRLYQYARLFGFGVFPGSGISGEAKGTLRVPSQWSGVSKHVVAFGQEVGVTALQLIGAYSAIANGGTLMEPSVVRAVLSEEGTVLWKAAPSAVRRVVSAETAKDLTRILTMVVQKGTGQMAQMRWERLGRVAGKTGTAQKFDSVRRRYCEDKTLVSFCGFFPAANPRVTMLVILDEPSGRRWGGLDAAPIFRRIAEEIGPDLLPSGAVADEPREKSFLALAKLVKNN